MFIETFLNQETFLGFMAEIFRLRNRLNKASDFICVPGYPKPDNLFVYPRPGTEEIIDCKKENFDPPSIGYKEFEIDGEVVGVEWRKAEAERSIYIIGTAGNTEGNVVIYNHGGATLTPRPKQLEYAAYAHPQEEGYEDLCIATRSPRNMGAVHLSERDEEAFYQYLVIAHRVLPENIIRVQYPELPELPNSSSPVSSLRGQGSEPH